MDSRRIIQLLNAIVIAKLQALDIECQGTPYHAITMALNSSTIHDQGPSSKLQVKGLDMDKPYPYPDL